MALATAGRVIFSRFSTDVTRLIAGRERRAQKALTAMPGSPRMSALLAFGVCIELTSIEGDGRCEKMT